jgi:hypothetical protein
MLCAPSSAEEAEPNHPTINAGDEKMVNGFFYLRTEGAGTVVLKLMALQPS